uniref:Uncharacterized protein n=1 Tax=Setaria digitata TaxID=48799 RepID=A0A915Q6P9_9BILA
MQGDRSICIRLRPELRPLIVLLNSTTLSKVVQKPGEENKEEGTTAENCFPGTIIHFLDPVLLFRIPLY